MPKFNKDKYQAKGASQRQLRVGEEIRHGLSEIFMRGELGDPRIEEASITVSEVRISPDLRNATAYVMPLNGDKKDEVLELLKNSNGMIRTLISKKMSLKFSPRVHFKLDGSFETASQIDSLLREAKERSADVEDEE
ncbi:MAG: 30S ribosome-binding factor RbfA [Rickettsiales bacterium]|nr:30S ribosome-binding factor RbfA [Rickettsiales bacterium]